MREVPARRQLPALAVSADHAVLLNAMAAHEGARMFIFNPTLNVRRGGSGLSGACL